MFSQVSVCPQVGCLPLVWGCLPNPPGQTPTLGRHPPPPQRILRDMVNKWAVCIPLECILVYNKNDTITILPERHDTYTKWYLFQTKFVIDIHVMFHVETLLFTKYSRLLITRKFTKHNLLLHNLQYTV